MTILVEIQGNPPRSIVILSVKIFFFLTFEIAALC